MENKNIKVELSIEEINLILSALLELPAKHVWNLITKLRMNMEEQAKELEQ